MTLIIQLLLGIIVLFQGRRLFWLFVALVGMLVGFRLAGQYFAGQAQGVLLVAGLVGAVAGALLAIFLQQLAVGLAGFLAGGYLLVSLVSALGWGQAQLTWLPFLIGGLLGVGLVFFLFDWALIVLSALLGASLIIQSLQLDGAMASLVFLILAAVGILLQAGMMRREAQVA